MTLTSLEFSTFYAMLIVTKIDIDEYANETVAMLEPEFTNQLNKEIRTMNSMHYSLMKKALWSVLGFSSLSRESY